MTDGDRELVGKYGICEYDREAHAAGTKKGERKRVGLSAQEIQQALTDVFGASDFANVVSDNFYDIDKEANPIPEGIENQLTVGYSELVPFLIGAVKELKAQNNAMSESLMTLREEYSELLTKVSKLLE